MKEFKFEYIVAGAGFSGICTAIKLRENGLENFVILERNVSIGGTWYDNCYPGAACDVESHLYSYSFEPNPYWCRQFGPQDEILHYMEHCVKKYRLNTHLRLNRNITSAKWDNDQHRWIVETICGEIYIAPILITCTGGLSEPAFPEIPGLSAFKGKIFHSARWEKGYDLWQKRVAVIGTGASAIQIVPAISDRVAHLDIYQRTPAWILPKRDKMISHFRKALYRYFPFTMAIYRSRLYWLHEILAVGFISRPGIMKIGSRLAEKYLHKSIPDKELRQKLTPSYSLGCKRILLSNDYYPALLKPQTRLITEGIECITETGIRTKDGLEHPAEAIILCTGFQAAEGVLRFPVTGMQGVDLNFAWRNGAEAYLGTTVSGFPNMFIVMGPNTGLGHSSMLLMIEAQVKYIMGCLKTMKQKKAGVVLVKDKVMSEYNKALQSRLSNTVWQSGGCRSWYQMKNGKNVTLWPGYTFSFISLTRHFNADKYDWA